MNDLLQALLNNPLWFYLFIVNVYLFCLMGYDKRKAQKKQWRVPESNLLFVGLLGGGLGGLLAQKVFHHKTRKRKFYICFLLGVVTDAVLLYFFH
ncbi:hypothetical protein BAU15_11180 [Enterococcus sp. JM4C]|uniref:DUF1294 domain-containing protein n=1 Tax=Candidatus Enterococcus huntleyi TaxID=1857217 RepID=UPI00137AB9AD|nr:DUF1294 domain-containing protein [Enterococcus sp. JM4C]KAF1298681.1 hypothetical protein BAU15_11180 [Enterococcus sp. JM4C]